MNFWYVPYFGFLFLQALISILVGSFLGAVVLKIGVRWALKFSISYWKAYKIFFIETLASFLVFLTLWLAYIFTPGGNTSREGKIFILQTLVFILSFMTFSAIQGKLISPPNTQQKIGFQKGLRVTGFSLLAVMAFCVPFMALGLIIGAISAFMR